MEITSTQQFIDYVVKDLGLSENEVLEISGWGELSTTLGALTLKLDLLDMFQVEQLLEVQDATRQLLGDAAVELGFLSEDQVVKLLDIQKWSRRTEILQRLFLADIISVDQYRKYIPQVYLL